MSGEEGDLLVRPRSTLLSLFFCDGRFLPRRIAASISRRPIELSRRRHLCRETSQAAGLQTDCRSRWWRLTQIVQGCGEEIAAPPTTAIKHRVSPQVFAGTPRRHRVLTFQVPGSDVQGSGNVNSLLPGALVFCTTAFCLWPRDGVPFSATVS